MNLEIHDIVVENMENVTTQSAQSPHGIQLEVVLPISQHNSVSNHHPMINRSKSSACHIVGHAYFFTQTILVEPKTDSKTLIIL